PRLARVLLVLLVFLRQFAKRLCLKGADSFYKIKSLCVVAKIREPCTVSALHDRFRNGAVGRSQFLNRPFDPSLDFVAELVALGAHRNFVFEESEKRIRMGGKYVGYRVYKIGLLKSAHELQAELLIIRCEMSRDRYPGKGVAMAFE